MFSNLRQINQPSKLLIFENAYGPNRQDMKAALYTTKPSKMLNFLQPTISDSKSQTAISTNQAQKQPIKPDPT